MNLTFAAKRSGSNWECAVIIDGKFQHAIIDASLDACVTKALGATLIPPRPEGTEVVFEIKITEPTDGSQPTTK